jgi:hypothetical protein
MTQLEGLYRPRLSSVARRARSGARTVRTNRLGPETLWLPGRQAGFASAFEPARLNGSWSLVGGRMQSPINEVDAIAAAGIEAALESPTVFQGVEDPIGDHNEDKYDD